VSSNRTLAAIEPANKANHRHVKTARQPPKQSPGREVAHLANDERTQG
jgi:hypothetical protein